MLALNKQVRRERTLPSEGQNREVRTQGRKRGLSLETLNGFDGNSTIVQSNDGWSSHGREISATRSASILVLGSQATWVLTLGDVSGSLRAGKVDEGYNRQGSFSNLARAHRGGIVSKDKKLHGKVTKSSRSAREGTSDHFEVRVSIQAGRAS